MSLLQELGTELTRIRERVEEDLQLVRAAAQQLEQLESRLERVLGCRLLSVKDDVMRSIVNALPLEDMLRVVHTHSTLATAVKSWLETGKIQRVTVDHIEDLWPDVSNSDRWGRRAQVSRDDYAENWFTRGIRSIRIRGAREEEEVDVQKYLKVYAPRLIELEVDLSRRSGEGVVFDRSQFINKSEDEPPLRFPALVRFHLSRMNEAISYLNDNDKLDAEETAIAEMLQHCPALTDLTTFLSVPNGEMEQLKAEHLPELRKLTLHLASEDFRAAGYPHTIVDDINNELAEFLGRFKHLVILHLDSGNMETAGRRMSAIPTTQIGRACPQLRILILNRAWSSDEWCDLDPDMDKHLKELQMLCIGSWNLPNAKQLHSTFLRMPKLVYFEFSSVDDTHALDDKMAIATLIHNRRDAWLREYGRGVYDKKAQDMAAREVDRLKRNAPSEEHAVIEATAKLNLSMVRFEDMQTWLEQELLVQLPKPIRSCIIKPVRDADSDRTKFRF